MIDDEKYFNFRPHVVMPRDIAISIKRLSHHLEVISMLGFAMMATVAPTLLLTKSE